jgi:hypothetical protein
MTFGGHYKGAIDKAISKKIRVVLCCWESASAKNGVIDNSADFFVNVIKGSTGLWQQSLCIF